MKPKVPILLTLTLLAASSMLVGLPPQAADWPGFLGQHRDGRSEESGLGWDWPEAGPSVVWTVEMGEGYAMASVADGRVFAFDRVEGKERLRALNAKDGRLLWEQSYPVAYKDAFGFSNGPRANPLIDGDRIYTFGVTGRLRCHAVNDGALRFDVDTSSDYGVIPNFFGVGSNPVVFGSSLLVMVGGSPADSPPLDSGETEANGSAIVAFDKKTGKEKFRTGQDLASYSSPIVVGRGKSAKGFALARGGLLYFDPGDGRQRAYVPWRAKKLYSVNAATPVIAGDKLFITESYGPGGQLLGIAGDDLKTIWKDQPRAKSIAAHWSTPVHREGYLYGSHGENRGSAELRAVRLSDGKVMWKHPGLGRSTLILAEDRLIVLSEEGQLLVAPASPKGFAPTSSVTPVRPDGTPWLKYPVWNAPALSDGRLFARGEDRLICLDLRPPVAPDPAP